MLSHVQLPVKNVMETNLRSISNFKVFGSSAWTDAPNEGETHQHLQTHTTMLWFTATNFFRVISFMIPPLIGWLNIERHPFMSSYSQSTRISPNTPFKWFSMWFHGLCLLILWCMSSFVWILPCVHVSLTFIVWCSYFLASSFEHSIYSVWKNNWG